MKKTAKKKTETRKQRTSKKAAPRAAKAGGQKPAAKRPASPPTGGNDRGATGATPYTPKAIEGTGWPAFRYPLP